MNTLEKTSFAGKREQDEEWDYYILNEKKVCIATDREAAYGRTVGVIPSKGCVLAGLGEHKGIETDVLEHPSPRVLIVKNLQKLPVTFVMVGYLTDILGIWTQYQKGVRNICGYSLPQGLKENQKFEKPLLIPITRGHMLSKETIYAEGLIDEDIFEQIEIRTAELFAQEIENAEKNKLVLASATYEFAAENGKAILLHGFHTTKTAVYWEDGIFLKLNVISQWLERVGFKGNGPAPPIPEEIAKQAFEEYLLVYKKLTGKALKVPKKDDDLEQYVKA